MLEALVSLRRNNTEIGGKESSTKKVGDIICIKKSPAIWGEKEKKDFLIVFLKDDELESEIDTKQSHGFSYPYAVYKEEVIGNRTRSKIINRSKRKVNINMFSNSKGLDSKVSSGAIKPNNKKYVELSDTILDINERK